MDYNDYGKVTELLGCEVTVDDIAYEIVGVGDRCLFLQDSERYDTRRYSDEELVKHDAHFLLRNFAAFKALEAFMYDCCEEVDFTILEQYDFCYTDATAKRIIDTKDYATLYDMIEVYRDFKKETERIFDADGKEESPKNKFDILNGISISTKRFNYRVLGFDGYSFHLIEEGDDSGIGFYMLPHNFIAYRNAVFTLDSEEQLPVLKEAMGEHYEDVSVLLKVDGAVNDCEQQV